MSKTCHAALRDLVAAGENELLERLYGYAHDRDYTRYSSTLVEAWRMSIAGLSASLIGALSSYDDVPELGPDDDYETDPCAAFGILEAQRHRGQVNVHRNASHRQTLHPQHHPQKEALRGHPLGIGKLGAQRLENGLTALEHQLFARLRHPPSPARNH